MIELALSLVLCALIGQLVDRALFGDPSCGWLERISRALLFGFGTVGSLSMLVDGLGLGVRPWSLGGAIGVAIAFAQLCPGRPGMLDGKESVAVGTFHEMSPMSSA